MAYDKDRPPNNTSIKDTVTGLQENFSQIKTVFDVNHGALTGTLGDEGKHDKVVFGQQALAPEFENIGLYGKSSALGDATDLELFFKQIELPPFDDEEFIDEFDFTSAGFDADDGWARLPNGWLIKWDFNYSITAPVSVDRTYTFTQSANIPLFERIFFADIVPRTRASGIADQNDIDLVVKSWSIGGGQTERINFSTMRRSGFRDNPRPTNGYPFRASVLAIGK